MKDSTFIELLNLYVDRQIGAADAARLEEEISRSPERRRTYQEYCRMHRACGMLFEQSRPRAELGAKLAAAAAQADAKVIAFPSNRTGLGGWAYAGGLAAAAAVAFFFFVPGGTDSIAPAGNGTTVVVAPPPAMPVKKGPVDILPELAVNAAPASFEWLNFKLEPLESITAVQGPAKPVFAPSEPLQAVPPFLLKENQQPFAAENVSFEFQK